MEVDETARLHFVTRPGIEEHLARAERLGSATGPQVWTWAQGLVRKLEWSFRLPFAEGSLPPALPPCAPGPCCWTRSEPLQFWKTGDGPISSVAEVIAADVITGAPMLFSTGLPLLSNICA